MHKLSIVLPYHNRKGLLYNVLSSIAYYQGDRDVEVVIIDDGSNEEHRIDNVQSHFNELNIVLKVLPNVSWRGPAYAYNEGFKLATGDVVLINSSECIHVGNVINYVFENMIDDLYMSFSACASSEEMRSVFNLLRGSQLTGYMVDHNNDWQVHSSLGNMIPYCAAISKKNLDELGGYDERFLHGIGFDDYDFTDRIYNLGLSTSIVDFPYVVHQWHPLTQYTNTINYDLLMRIREEEPKRIKSKINHTY